MTDIRPLSQTFWVAPQITPEDVREAAAKGVRLVINNRPDGEEPGQPAGAEIEAAAKEAGLAYIAIPIRGGNIGEADLDAFDVAVANASGVTLAYCRSGMRSAALRALARARAGGDVEAILREAAEAGYDLAGLRPRLEALAALNNG
ncbi:TIGR01244 family sulfur transferase [Amphiplicatus metriothermophilus]|uniref:TIGR01244 family protein n=1 Tax=Amphiplicatus metriothermophilus TaxID=1519374 RepID=A0A239PID2_9PROT|nr:TIGR01244 family sulfur transferase [Amphiplicatus metriothermophilus]MBB5518128.1 uncharacterized protein (TIGR01244 family) [Amphiplicatus metriothermophilus]SNT67538.1 TIGR01244 family protein [Amphiplicatus metriothermophilus]